MVVLNAQLFWSLQSFSMDDDDSKGILVVVDKDDEVCA